ncbi:TPA: hypothetical protein DDW35_13495 [Candidatus Sumerlaeota bacterium]|nr:hypothetical protein [Candidatus Sumerlaeota bacterium]
MDVVLFLILFQHFATKLFSRKMQAMVPCEGRSRGLFPVPGQGCTQRPHPAIAPNTAAPVKAVVNIYLSLPHRFSLTG